MPTRMRVREGDWVLIYFSEKKSYVIYVKE